MKKCGLNDENELSKGTGDQLQRSLSDGNHTYSECLVVTTVKASFAGSFIRGGNWRESDCGVPAYLPRDTVRNVSRETFKSKRAQADEQNVYSSIP